VPFETDATLGPVSARAPAAAARPSRPSRVAAVVSRVEALPAVRVLAAFIVVEWLAIAATARVVRHNGWIYYQGGDQLWYYTLGWLLGHGQLTQTPVGYGWSLLLAPVSWIAGPDLVSALPAIVVFDVLVLMPVAMLALYGIASRIGGRLFGYWALLLWVVLPFVGVLYTNNGYHQRYTELLLPQAFGLTAMADFPTLVATLVSIYFCTKVLFSEQPELVDAVAAGVAAGVAIAIKPATVLFLVGPVLALAYRRRIDLAAAMGAAIVPAAIALAVWKGRGLGNIPLLSLGPHGESSLAAAAPVGALDLGKYWHQLNWSHFGNNVDLLREHFWSGRLIQWLVLAGLIGLARVSRCGALLIGGWFFAFALVKGSYSGASIEDGSLFRIMMPAYPAFLLLLASVPLLLPHAPAALRAWRPVARGPGLQARWGAIAVVVFLSAVVPLGAFAAARTSGGLDPATVGTTIMPIPANVDLGLSASVHGRRVELAWRSAEPAGGPVFYRIWRDRSDGFTCPPASGARLCKVVLPEIGTTHAGTFVDRPAKGTWVYRVALAANWLNDPAFGDPYLVSRSVSVTVP
jgi:hypothetical protein